MNAKIVSKLNITDNSFVNPPSSRAGVCESRHTSGRARTIEKFRLIDVGKG
ncbi:MAG TPA: hypothetical protein VIX58_10510 [Anaerolineae bacterium]